ncbi:MAG: M20/M25/M40 family metallo-hydrolase [Candidatus Aminicenantales bacterium]
MKIFLRSVCVVLILSAVVAAAAQDKSRLDPGAALDPSAAKALAGIRGSEAYAYVEKLASPEFAGRFTGDEGYTAAARWAADLFKKWGLRPVDPKAGYLLPYPSPYTIVRSAEMTLISPDGKTETNLKPNVDFLPLFYTDSGNAEAGLVFAGWGISAPELNYDDYAGLDVKGKFILCFRGQPDREDRRFEYYDEHRTRMKTARDKGAFGLIYIYPEPISNPNGDWQAGFTPAMISEKTADLILAEIKNNSADLKKALTSYRRPIGFDLKSRIRYAVVSEHHPDGIGYNVAGFVEGSDPVLRKDVIVIGGHFDHDGLHLGFLYPGADDNASGSATVMEIAQAFSELKRKPRRSVAFVLFGGEEMGLQGSTHFAAHPPTVFSKIDAMFNYDMTGEGDGAWGGVTDEKLKAVFLEADKRVGVLRGLEVMRGPAGVRGSDFAPFMEKGITAAAVGSNGPHLAYHATGDTIYRINPTIMADIAKVSFLAALAWADR